MPAANINLLPVDLSAKSGIAKLAALLKRTSFFMLATFLVLGFLAGAFIIFFSIQLDSTNKTNQNLSAQISTLEVTEQKTVLIKDRLQKVKSLGTQKDVLSGVDAVNTITETLPSGVSLAEVNLDTSGTVQFSFNVTDSSTLVSFLANLVSQTDFKNLSIKSFSFTPVTGYLVSFEAVAK